MVKTDLTNRICNFGQYLEDAAINFPDKKALIFKHKFSNKYTHMTFLELNKLCDKYAHSFKFKGVQKGHKVLILKSLSTDFVAISFAIFKIGAIPVIVDPGMSIKILLNCIKKVQPDVFVGVFKAHILRFLFPKYFSSLKIIIFRGVNKPFSKVSVSGLTNINNSDGFKIEKIQEETPAALVFTSGATLLPKAVIYTHGFLNKQIDFFKKLYDLSSCEIDLPGIPGFILFDIAMQRTSFIQEINLTKPAKINPKSVTDVILRYKVISSFGSPVLWKRIADHCIKNNLILPSLKKVLIFGAPVPVNLIKDLSKIIPNADIATPYGATECLILTSIGADEILSHTIDDSFKCKGICIGTPIPEITLNVIEISDNPINHISNTNFLPPHQIGEIIVKGSTVIKKYYNDDAATNASKIFEENDIWHRTGDLGYIDETGKLWFCGRKKHKVTCKKSTLFTVPTEAIYNTHEKVNRSALVGIGDIGNQMPVIIIEPYPQFFPTKKKEKIVFENELNEIARSFPELRDIKHILFHRSLPVDIRHNSKIIREKLTIWAKDKLL